MNKEIIIDIKPENYSKVEEFIRFSYGPIPAGYGGGAESVDIMYDGGISLRSSRENFFSKEFSKHQIVINIPQNFNKEKLKELERLATN